MSTDVTGLPLIKAFKSDIFPLDRIDPGSDLGALLSRILVTEWTQEIYDPGPGGRFEVGLTVADEAVLNLVGLEGFALVFGGASSTTLHVGAGFTPAAWQISISAGVRLRFPRNLLKPVMRSAETWVDDPSRAFAELNISAGVIIDSDWDIDFDGANAFHLEPAMIADSGLVIEGDVALDLSETRGLPASAALGLPTSWKGIVFTSLNVYLPTAVTQAVPISSLSLTNFHIGTGGVTGSIALNGSPGPGSLGGFPFTPSRLEVELRQNCLVGAEFEGQLTLAFFDEPLNVTAGFDLAGNLNVAVSAASGLVELTKPGVLTVEVDGLRFAVENGVFLVGVSGRITPLIGGLDWPSVTVRELSVDSTGKVRLEGGWLDLPDHYSLDFFGFHVGIARLGLGSSDDGGKWIGFSGDIKLVDRLSIGGSVDGLKVTWYDDGRAPKLTLEGVGVELEIPEVLRFKGSVSYHELPGPQRRFDGDITLELLALDLRIDGKIVIGVDTDPDGHEFTFFALYIGVELPAGIPLWATGLGLYGIAGLVAIEMTPNKGAAPNVLHPQSRAEEEWFENLDGSAGWYERPAIGITDLRSKWDPEPGGFALGGGVTIGTLPDNGFTFNGSVLLVISFPGPVILLEGKANLLKQRSSLTDDALFRALVVLDFRAGNMLIGLDAKYKVGSDAELLEIGGSAEAFFDFADASRWHLYLGRKDPKEKRIRAQILSLFEANAYFMIDAEKLQTGAWVGYDKHWDFGPLSVVIEAWIEGGVILSWKPIFFHGQIWLHGKVELRVFGFGFGLHADARFACDVFDPFHVLAELSVGISLPWPLPDFDVDITLEWGPTPDEPPLPLPLKEIAVEHFKSTASWPLPRTDLLLPAVDSGDGYLAVPPPAPNLAAPAPAHAPVVPLDARPHLTFGRAVHDDALIGVNPQPVLPAAVPAGWERVGDPDQNQGPMRIRFAVKEVTLSRWNGASWDAVARKASTPNPAGLKELYGSWAPLPQLPSGTVAPGTDPPTAQVKLWLWSKSPFDFSMHGGSAWDEWFTDSFPGYPCVPPVRLRTVCCDFDDLPVGTAVPLPQHCRTNQDLVYVGRAPVTVEQLDQPSHGHTQALCWDDPGRGRQTAFGIVLTGEPASRMTLVLAGHGAGVERRCLIVDQLGRAVFATGKVDLPLAMNGTTLRLFGSNGAELGSGAIRNLDGRHGVDVGWWARADLPCAADSVEIEFWQGATPTRITGLDATGTVVTSHPGVPQPGLVTLTLTAPAGATITRVMIDAAQDETYLLQLCSFCAVVTAHDVQVTAIDVNGVQSGPFTPSGPVGDTVTVEVAGLRGVEVHSGGHACLVQVCVTYQGSDVDVAAHEEMAKRLRDSMALWGDEGEVLRPYSDYRLTVVTNVQAVGEAELSGVNHTHDITELAYFRTAGPPALTALSSPVHQPPEEAFDSGLDDLTRYVRQTVPATVPARGERPVLPRPVYRAYDVGVEFNEDYVDLMYRLANRNLMLYLVDANNAAVRDVTGRIVVATNRWAVTDSTTLTESTVRYLTVIGQSTCVATDPQIIPKQQTLYALDPGLILDPGRVHEARLVPLLMHEDFRDGLAGWTVIDAGDQQAPSAWSALGHPLLAGAGATATGAVVTLPAGADLSAVDQSVDVVLLATDTARPDKTYRIVTVDPLTRKLTLDGTATLLSGTSGWRIPGWGAARQTSNIWGGDDTAASEPKPGTTLVGGTVSWTDYRVSVLVRSGDDDAIGLSFRWIDGANHYRYSMDRERGYRRLVRVVSGVHTVLAEDDAGYLLDQDYLITVEAIGSSLRVYQDGEPVFAVADSTHAHGRIGLYCWANQDARFADVRVDDFGQNAPIAYRFGFTTSAYVDVSHQLHSFDDRSWVTPAAAGLGGAAAAAAPLSGAVTQTETRAFTGLAEAVLGAGAQRPAAQVEVHRVLVGGDPAALLLRGPEPIDWTRTSMAVSRADGPVPAPTPPGLYKITEVAPGGAAPNDETITVLARDRASLAGTRLETYGIAGPLLPAVPAVLLDDTFDIPVGVLMQETFGPDALTAYRIVDADGAAEGPSQWAVSGGRIVQTSNIWAGADFFGTDPTRGGTVAVTGGRWGDVRLTAVLRSGDDDAIGVVFRYRDDSTWYRFSMDVERPYRRLVKCVGGVVSTLWEDGFAYTPNQDYHVRIEAYRDLIIGSVDDVPLFTVQDGDIREGQVGWYCFANVDARFEALRVEALSADPRTDPAARAGDWEIVDTTPLGAPSAWGTRLGSLRQTSGIGLAAVTAAPGTYALRGQDSWRDYRITAQMRCDGDDAIGVVFRYTDPGNWYRLSLNAQAGYRRLDACVGGAVTTLWADAVGYPPGKGFTVGIDAVGDRLVGRVGDSVLFDLVDAAHPAGRVGLYTCANRKARFERVTVALPPLAAYAAFTDRFAAGDLASWTVSDAGTASAPSAWAIAASELVQTSNIYSDPVDAATIDKPGTQAVAGDPGWTDVIWTVRLRSDDNDAIGVLFRYAGAGDHYRFSMDAERGYRRLVSCSGGVFSTLWEDQVAYQVGRSYQLTIASIGSRHQLWLDGVPLLEVEDATHPAGRVGLYCWADEGARFSGVQVFDPATLAAAGLLAGADLLDEDFTVAVPGLWSIHTAGDQNGPAAWSVTGGELVQSSNVWGGDLDPGSLEKPGTAAILTLTEGVGATGLVPGSTSWTDYRVSVRLRSDDDDAIGVLFRYAGPDDWYRFSMDRERGYRRLVRSVAGVVEELWSDTQQYLVGREYLVSLDALGDTLVGYVDGAEIFSVRDSAHPAGTVGLYCWAVQGARFAGVKVGSANWWALHQFGSEEPKLEAGTKVVVHSGNELAWTALPKPGVEHRFTAQAQDPGRTRLPATRPVDLRLRTTTGTVLHARRFLPATAYIPVGAAQILRNADGTELALFAGTPLAPGEYRLRFTYRRDNTAAAPGSTVLSRAGDSADEVITLDVPW